MVKKRDGSNLCGTLTRLSEAKNGDDSKGLAEVCVIQPGFNTSGTRYYPAEMLRRDFGIFEGSKMFMDHPTEEEEWARPEGSLANWVGTLQEVRVDASGAVHGSPKIHAPAFRDLMSNLAEADCLSDLGVSIRASGQVKEGEIEDRKTGIVDSLDYAYSVDFVTYPGAGGHAKFYESEDFTPGELTMETDVQERFEALEKSVKESTDHMTKLVTDVAETMGQVSEAVAKLSIAAPPEDPPKEEDADPALAEAQALLKDASEKLTASEAKNKALEARGGIVEAIKASKLPEPSQKRLIDAHGGSGDLETAKAAIVSEAAYVAELNPKGGAVSGLGAGDEEDGETKISESERQEQIEEQTARYISEGKDPETAKVMAISFVGR